MEPSEETPMQKIIPSYNQ